MGYLKKSIQKFKDDFLAKGIYDTIKKIVIGIVVLCTPLIIPENFGVMKFLNTEYIIKVYLIITYTVLISIVSHFIFRKYFYNKYNKLKKDNFTDELTGLKNHKALEEYLINTVELLKTGNKIKTVSVILIDIDNFKKFNSTYGHIKSDEILKKLGQLIGSDKRATDETFRLFHRGDEFIVVAKDTNIGEAFTAAERKRNLIKNNVFSIDNENFSLTVSCGVTEFKKENDTIDSFINRASNALSLAKEIKGKNNTKSNS